MEKSLSLTYYLEMQEQVIPVSAFVLFWGLCGLVLSFSDHYLEGSISATNAKLIHTFPFLSSNVS